MQFFIPTPIRKYNKKVPHLLVLLMLCFLTACGKKEAAFGIVCPTVNYQTNPLAIDGIPVFGWQMEAAKQGAAQTAFQITIATSPEELQKKNYIWDSGKVSSSQSVAIPYGGDALTTNTDYYWTVQVWNEQGKSTQLESPAIFHTGLSEADWQGAQWLTAPKEEKEAKPFIGTISYITFCQDSISGFLFGPENEYGDYYRVTLDTLEEQPMVRISEMHYETVVAESSFPTIAEDYVFYEEQAHRFFLSVSEGCIDVAIDHKPLGRHTIVGKQLPLENFGFWTTRGAYYGYYDDLEIYEGQTVSGDLAPIEVGFTPTIEEHFDDPSNCCFSPYFCRMKELDIGEEPWLQVGSGFLMTPGSMEPAPIFAKAFQVDPTKELKGAKLYTSALGIIDPYLNGQPVSDAYYAPGQSTYSKEVYYSAYDISTQVKTGETNLFSVVLGHGRYDKAKSEWGDTLAFTSLLQLDYTDGTTDFIPSDDSFSCYTDGPIRNDDMYGGEFYDARKEVSNWDITTWPLATPYAFEGSLKEPQKVAMISPFDVCIEKRSPSSITELGEGTYVVDFGDNVTGFCELNALGTPDTPVVIRYAEALNEDTLRNADDEPGTIWTQGLGSAKNTDYYIPKENSFLYAPRLVYRGFRYVQITGLTGPLEATMITAKVMSADNQTTGEFTCSDENLNRLYQAIYRTQRNNYVDIPTDCPQRDERFGWAGDAQIFAQTGAYNANTYSFMKEYLHTFMLQQNEAGAFTDMVSSYDNHGSSGWADAGIILPWILYQQFGDKQLIVDYLPAMCKYMDYLLTCCDDYVRSSDTNFSYGDHLAPSSIDSEMSDTLQCAYVANLLSKMCQIAGEAELAVQYRSAYESYKKVFQTKYMNPDGSVGNWMQAEYVLPLAFQLFPEDLEAIAARNLDISVQSSDYHVQTGYISTPWLLPTLSKYGYADTAYGLLQQESFPSWNYMLSHNNTTLTEAFWAFTEYEDGTYSIENSLNHPALGSIGAWFYNGILGIKQDEDAPGFKHFYLEPMISNRLSYAAGSYDSVYGKISSQWILSDEHKLSYTCTIPANTTATLILPLEGWEPKELHAGTYSMEYPLP